MTEHPALATNHTRLPLRDRVFYGVGGITDAWGINGLKVTWIPILGLVMGLNPAVLGVIIAITRLFDAFTDPFVGWLSDRSRSKWGRRRPFIAVGACACGLLFPLIWLVPGDWSDTGRYAWVLISTLLFYLAFAVFTVPYHALGYELTDDYHGRTSVMATRTVFIQVVSFGSGWIFALVTSGLIGSPEVSVVVTGFAIGLVIALCGGLPAWKLRETAASQAQRERLPGLGASLRTTLRNANFVRLLITVACIAITVNATSTIGTYVSVYYTLDGVASAGAVFLGWSSTIWVALALGSVPLVSRLAKRFGKRDTLVGCLTFAAVGCVARWFLFTPASPWLQILDPIFFAPTLTALFMLAESMIADVCEEEQLRSGIGLAGMFGAVFAWTYKAGQAAGLMLSGFALQWTGFDKALGGDQTEATFLIMRLAFCLLPGIALLIGIAVLGRYRLATRPAEAV